MNINEDKILDLVVLTHNQAFTNVGNIELKNVYLKMINVFEFKFISKSSLMPFLLTKPLLKAISEARSYNDVNDVVAREYDDINDI
jgi:hypothetical protein